MQEDDLIRLIGIDKDYGGKDNLSHVLKDVNLTIKIGEFVSIMGPSGSGKTTLMNIIGLLDTPSTGQYLIDYQDTKKLSDNAISNIRKSKIGFVFQDYNLLTRYNVFENVALPMRYSPLSKKVRDNRVKEVLGMVGLSERMYDKVNHLSGGQAQRVAIARALVNNPDIILADEPTGNLDSRNATEILRLMRDLNQLGVTIVLVTHNPDIARVTSRVISIVDGCVKGDVDLDKGRSKPKTKTKDLRDSKRTIKKIGTKKDMPSEDKSVTASENAETESIGSKVKANTAKSSKAKTVISTKNKQNNAGKNKKRTGTSGPTNTIKKIKIFRG